MSFKPFMPFMSQALVGVLVAGVALYAQRKATPKAAEPEAVLNAIKAKVMVQGPVCPDPEKPCAGFKTNELSFQIAKKFNFDRGRDKSAPFYAVILRSAPLCSIKDEERVRAQNLFPKQKVFVHQYFCNEFENKVTYTNVEGKVGFLAVYAGEKEADARALLAKVQTLRLFPGANLRKMEAVVVYQIE